LFADIMSSWNNTSWSY